MKRWLLLLLLAPVVLWSIYWTFVALSMRQGLDAALSGDDMTGLSGQVQESRVSGFPSQFRFDLVDLELHQAGGISAAIPGLQLAAPAYTPHLINLELDSPQSVTTRFGQTVIDADLFRVGIFMRPKISVPLDRIVLRLEAAHVTDASQETGLGIDHLTLGFFETEQSQSGETEGLYRLNIEGRGINLSDYLLDFPEEYRRISNINADIGLIYSRLWDRSVFNTGAPVLSNVIIPESRLTFGPSEISLQGQLSVGPQSVLNGDVMLEIDAWRGLLAALTQAGILDPDIEAIILQLMDGQDDEDAISLPLTIENNLVTFGVFTLGFLPVP